MTRTFLVLGLFAASLHAQNTYNITTFTVPGALQTAATNLSDDGVVVGIYTATGADGQVHTFGFSRSASGEISTLVPPGASGDVFAEYISSQGSIYGYYTVGSNADQGFVLKDGAYRLLSVGGKSTMVLAGNDNGALLVGFPQDPFSYLYRPGQALIPLAAPNQDDTYGTALNDSGLVVGYFDSDYGEQLSTSGFTLIGNTYIPLNVPRQTNFTTMALGISSSGVTVGSYFYQNMHYHGFIDAHGKFSDFAVPGADETYLFGCNAQGVLSGYYQFADGESFGFIATPIQ